ncbi:MAG TPA: thymidine phosphorylase [Methylomirabilota bacterium]|nr:thymidine phosphorylase [Methylomirabilota bacterium]
MDNSSLALGAVQKKLIGKKLNYQEIYAIMDEIAHQRFGDILTTYFAASGYSKGFTNEEIYFLTKAMIETGDKLHFKGIVADKHSIGGVPGTRTTLVVVPIVAAAGFTIPKSSSRAITTPGGTADDMEVLAPVTFSKEQIYRIVEKTNACIVWGGSVDIAPADDELIKVEEPLLLESYDKFLVSIMAKKIAFGSNHIVIDLPYGEHVKVHLLKDAETVKRKFDFLAEKFGVKMHVNLHEVNEPAGRGIGPLLEVRESLKVLEQKADRPLDLEKRIVSLAGILLDLCLKDASSSVREHIRKEFGSGLNWAKHLLTNGQALKKMREIIQAQGGKSDIMSEHLQPGKHSYAVLAKHKQVVKKINSKNATVLAKILGAPAQKKSGIYLHKKIHEQTAINEPMYTLYSESAYFLKEAKDSLKNFPILEYE